MTDKEQFTFDDSNSQSQGDLKDAFEETYPEGQEGIEPPPQAKPSEPKARPLILFLLLIVVVAGGYYFLTPSETTQDNANTSEQEKEAVASPSQVSDSKAVAKAPVPSPPVSDESEPKPGLQISASTETSGSSEKMTAEQEPSEGEQSSQVASVNQEAVSTSSETAPQEAAPADDKVGQTRALSPETYRLDAGSYLFASNIQEIVKKIRSLGYEPEVMVIEEQVPMTRLKLGLFSEADAREALAKAKQFEPSSFTLRQGDKYGVYAGTFYVQDNVDRLQKKLLQQGIAAEQESIRVVRKLNRVRFGDFSSREEAVKASSQATSSGLANEIVQVE
jgi:cell division protein FtsN